MCVRQRTLTLRNDRFVRAMAPSPLRLELSNVSLSLSLSLSQVHEGDGTTAFEAACAPGHQECVKELCAAVTKQHLVRILGLSREGEREEWRGRREGEREREEGPSAEQEQVMSQVGGGGGGGGRGGEGARPNESKRNEGGGVGRGKDDQGGERSGDGRLEDCPTQESVDWGPNRGGRGSGEGQESLDLVPSRCRNRDGGIKLEGFRHWHEKQEEIWDGEERRIRERLAFLRFGGVCEPEARSALARALSNGYGASN